MLQVRKAVQHSVVQGCAVLCRVQCLCGASGGAVSRWGVLVSGNSSGGDEVEMGRVELS
jgi:hypothetical protein